MSESTGELQRAGTGVKPPLSYILDFGPALDRIVEVMERGAKKYSRNNWKGGGKNAELAVQLDSVMRHLAARQCGEVYDADMGTDHLANAVCGLLFALYHHGKKPADRVKDCLSCKFEEEYGAKEPCASCAPGYPNWQPK